MGKVLMRLCAVITLISGAIFSAPLVAADELVQERVVAQFELPDAGGELVALEDFRGRYVLVSFGFTQCHHICPMMAATMGRVLRETDQDAVGIFISVDTERDSPEITDRYAKQFSEKMLGLSGNYEQIVAAAKNFDVTFVVTKSDTAYTVQHTPNIYLIDPQGEVVDVFPLNAKADTVVEAMRKRTRS